MKIAFPLISEKELASDFTRASYIGIYDELDGKTDMVPLSGLEKDLGIAVFFDAMATQGLKLVASKYYSYMSLRVFKEHNIEALKAVSVSLAENIRQFKSGALKPFPVYESLLFGECANDCSGCGSGC